MSEKEVCWDTLCFGHIWQSGPSCKCPVAVQQENLEEKAEKQKLEATLNNQRQLGVEKSDESEHKNRLHLEIPQGNKREAKQG